MDFNDTPQEAAFRAEVQNWLTANVPTEAELAGYGLHWSRQALAKEKA